MTPIQKKMLAKKQAHMTNLANAAKEKQKREQASKQRDPLEVLDANLSTGLKKWKNLDEDKVDALTFGYEDELKKIQKEIEESKKVRTGAKDQEAGDLKRRLAKKGAISATLQMLVGDYTLADEQKVRYPPELCNLMENFINLPVSNARCERIFSHLKLVYSKRRYNLDQETINAIMFLKINNLIPKKSQHFWDRQMTVTTTKVTQTNKPE